MLNHIPAHIGDETGTPWTITRAWPSANGSTTFEATNPSIADVRGGRFASNGDAVLAPLGTDPRLPQLATLAGSGTIVVHRPGRRVVIRSADEHTFIKVVRPGRGQAVADATVRGATFGSAFRVPAIVSSTPDAVHFAALRGRTLHEIGTDPAVTSTEWASLWESWAHSWSTVVQARDHNAPAGEHSAHSEVDVVRTWAAHAQRLTDSRAEVRTLAATADWVSELLRETEPDPLVTSHRDLHDKQLLWASGSKLALLDLDTVTRAEAALDLGNLSAHLWWRHKQGLWSAGRSRSARTVVDEAADQLGVSAHRLHAYTVSARFRIACVYGYRPRWAAIAAEVRREMGDHLPADA